MTHHFTIRDWQAWAPALADRAAWDAWIAAPFVPVGAQSPPLAEMAPMQRRRVDHLGRMALQVAWWCQPEADARTPLVFATRHGELSRTYDMLRTLARDEPLSPTHFGLSTHNAIGAQYGIARSLPANYLAVSAGPATAEAAFVEAIGLLVDGADEVVVVMYEAPLPAPYAGFGDEPDADYAWACRVALARPGEPAITLQTGDLAVADAAAATLPHGLDVLRLIAGAVDELALDAGERGWRWRRHA
jgi:hypothetical protein